MSMKTSNNVKAECNLKSLGSLIPNQLVEEIRHADMKLKEALGSDIIGYVANRLQLSPKELSLSLAKEQVDGVALAIYNIEGRAQSVIIGDQTGIGKGRQAAAMIRYGMLYGYLPIFLTDRYTLFSDIYRDCKALGIQEARPMILNTKVSIVDFDKPIEDEKINSKDEIWTPNEEDTDDEEMMGIYMQHYEEVYKSPKKSELNLMYEKGDIPENRFEYVMLTYSQLKDARRDSTRLEFLASLCKRHRVLFIFDEAHKSSSVSAGKTSIITQGINSILQTTPETQCVFLSATFAKRPECMITFMRKTVLNSLATHDTLKEAFSNGGVPMQEYVASKLAKEGQMVRREHSNENLPEPIYTYLDHKLNLHSELFDKVMYWFREIVKVSDMVKSFLDLANLMDVKVFRAYPTKQQLFYVNKILLLSLKAGDVAAAAVKEVRKGRSVVIGMSDTLECILRDSLDSLTGECRRADFSTILLRLLEKTIRNPKDPKTTIFDLDLSEVVDPIDLVLKMAAIKENLQTVRQGIKDEIFHLPMSPIDIIRQLITEERFVDSKGVERNIRFEECTGRARQLEYLSPAGDDDFINAIVKGRKKRHSNHIYNDFQNNRLDVILINACGAIGASAHATATSEVPENEVRQRKMLIVQNDLDVNIDLQKRGRINRTGQLENIPPLYEYIITSIPSEKRLNMMLRAKLRSLSANTTGNQDQDKRHADFLDITNKYGNLVSQEYILANPELENLLGLSSRSTATQLLARIAMLSVANQQEIIDEVFSAYQNLEQELRRINQWDLECEFRDFEAEFVREELFSASIDESALGGASMITTFKCRHRTYPYDSKTLENLIGESSKTYGENLSESIELSKEIGNYYRSEYKKIRDMVREREEKLLNLTLEALKKYGMDTGTAHHAIGMAQGAAFYENEIEELIKDFPHYKRIRRKLESYQKDFIELEAREKKDLSIKRKQKQRLLNVISKAKIGQAYSNILSELPVQENVARLMAVLKEVRFDKNPAKRFLPGKVQFVFALSAIHKEMVLNLVDKGAQNNYDRLENILNSPKWEFNPKVWDTEIAKYNNRILERKIITGNILGAYANPLINKMNPRFITFSLKEPREGSWIERGLLLPMTGENLNNLLTNITLPLADGLKFTTSPNNVYTISGIGIDFSIIPFISKSEGELKFDININEKDSRKFESDSRFDEVRKYFKDNPVTSIYNYRYDSKRRLKRYSIKSISANSEEFTHIMTTLANLRAVIMIPRAYLTVGEMNKFTQERTFEVNSNWPKLDWQISPILPPLKEEKQVRITAPVLPDPEPTYVDEYSMQTIICRETISFQGKSLQDLAMLSKFRKIYFDWLNHGVTATNTNQINWKGICRSTSNDMHRILVNATKQPEVKFNDFIYRTLETEIKKYKLSAVGEIKKRYREEMLFMAPPKEKVQKFLEDCLYDTRLDGIRKSLEDYLNDKKDIISDL